MKKLKKDSPLGLVRVETILQVMSSSYENKIFYDKFFNISKIFGDTGFYLNTSAIE